MRGVDEAAGGTPVYFPGGGGGGAPGGKKRGGGDARARGGARAPARRGPRPRRTRRGTVRTGNEAGADAAALECRDLREWISGGRRGRVPGRGVPRSGE